MKSLIIYYSRCDENYMSDGIRIIDKGNTEIVAEKLQKLTNADMFKIEVVNPYPVGYYDCCNVAKEELHNNARPEIKNKLNDISEYDTIYIGSPIWWDHVPMCVYTALEGLDFTGKVVKYFITNEGSGLGSTLTDITKLCNGALIKEGLSIRGSNASTCDNLLNNWL